MGKQRGKEEKKKVPITKPKGLMLNSLGAKCIFIHKSSIQMSMIAH